MRVSRSTQGWFARYEPAGMTFGDIGVTVLGLALVLAFPATSLELRPPVVPVDQIPWALEARLDSLCLVLLLVSLARKSRYGTSLRAVDILLGLGAVDFVGRQPLETIPFGLRAALILSGSGALVWQILRLFDPVHGRGRIRKMAATDLLFITILLYRVFEKCTLHLELARLVPLGDLIFLLASEIVWTMPYVLASSEIRWARRKWNWVEWVGFALVTTLLVLWACYELSSVYILGFEIRAANIAALGLISARTPSECDHRAAVVWTAFMDSRWWSE